MISYEGAEYFLFNSKTGTCSDYATAFVLLAREAGLAARYAEVYLPEDSFSEYGRNTYMVTQSDSHAYAEVFLENTGWLVFDPTSGVRNRERAGLIRFFKAIHVDYAMILIIARVLILLALFFLFIQFILPLVGEDELNE